MLRKKNNKNKTNQHNFHLIYHRSFSERTLTAKCLGKEEVLETIRKLHSASSMLGPITITGIFELIDGEKKAYKTVQTNNDSITDIQPIIQPSV